MEHIGEVHTPSANHSSVDALRNMMSDLKALWLQTSSDATLVAVEGMSSLSDNDEEQEEIITVLLEEVARCGSSVPVSGTNTGVPGSKTGAKRHISGSD